MAFNLNKKFTVILLPDDGSESKTFTLRSIWIFLLAFFILAAGTAGWFSVDVYKKWASLDQEYNSLKKRFSLSKREISAFANKFDTLENKVSRLDFLEAKFKNLTSINDPQRNLAIGPLDSVGNELSNGERATKNLNIYFDQIYTLSLLFEKSFLIENKSLKLGERLEKLETNLSSQLEILGGVPSIWPVKGWVTSGFGLRSDPFTNRRVMHKGMDIAAPGGTPIIAPATGKVRMTAHHSGYGKLIVVDHLNGITTKYGHLKEIYVKIGQKIKRGQKIGIVGNTGRSTGPHLHYEVLHHDIPLDPRRFILD